MNMKMLAKQLNRSASKCEADEKKEKLNVKKAIEKGNVQGARIYCQNAIRKKNEALQHMSLSSQLDAVVSRLKSQVGVWNTQHQHGLLGSFKSAVFKRNCLRFPFNIRIYRNDPLWVHTHTL